MTILLSLAVALLAGLAMTRVFKPLKLPAVTAYLVAGILVGPFCLGLLGIEGLGFTSSESVAQVNIICDVALGFIAFAIGSEFKVSQLKQVGKKVLIVGIFEAVTATVVVDVALVFVHFAMPDKLSLPAAITLGAIAAATAPAATLMVVRQYKAKGPLTSLLLKVVALDDAIGLIVFAISFGIARALQGGEIDAVSIVVEPIISIVGSLLLGLLMGFLLHIVERFFNSNSKRLAITITFVLLTVALSKLSFAVGPVNITFSSLLVCMMLGAAFCNLCSFSDELMERADKWTMPLYILFFVLSGAGLQLDVFADIMIVLIGVVYIFTRVGGKFLGAYTGCMLTHCESNVKKNLGITLFPQAGVALGMSLMVGELGEQGMIIRNIILFAVLIYELVGPTLTKMALQRAGEISPIPQDVLDRRKTKKAQP